MRVVLASRFPLIDVLEWKLRIAAELKAKGVELLVVHSRCGLADQLRYVVEALREKRPGPGPASAGRGRTQAASSALALLASPRNSLHQWARANGVRTHRTRRLGDSGCLAAVEAFGPDAMLLLGADIVPPSLLERVNGPTLNPHFGLLPEYRGMNVTEWAIFNDDPIGVSIHTVDAGIDTGAIVERRRVPVREGDDLAALRVRQRAASVESLLAAVDALRDGGFSAVAQNEADGRQYYRMHPRLRARVVEKLRRGEYRWLEANPVSPEADPQGRLSSPRLRSPATG